MKVIKGINTLVSAALEVFPERGTAGPCKVVHKLLFFLLACRCVLLIYVEQSHVCVCIPVFVA